MPGKLPTKLIWNTSWCRPTLLVAVAFLTVVSAGCHRNYYRKQADGEVHALIDEKANHVARGPNAPIRVDVDRRSRMFNPFDVDFQPMPIDDPASYQYMQCVDGRRGYPMWEAAGVTNAAESPDWWEFLPLNDDGVLVLDADMAVRIALLHSPDYQNQVEQLYLSALAVSAERFQFDTQFFGGTGFGFTRLGETRAGVAGGSSQIELGSNYFSMQRNLATGGQLVAGIANSIVWELSGPNTRSATTILDFTVLQPLLRTAGRDIVLEGLTSSERALLANIRSFERFRRSFYLNVTIGRPLESTVQLGPTSVGNVGSVGFGAGGFLGLLQSELQIRNTEENIARQAENLQVLEASLDELNTTIQLTAGVFVQQRLQVAQARSQLLRSQSGLVVQQANFQRTLDQFLSTLGLPPYICVELKDPILRQFELIDRTLLVRKEELTTLRENLGNINVAILELGEYQLDAESGVPVAQIEWSDELAAMLTQLRAEVRPLVSFSKDLIESDLPIIEADIEILADSVTKRTSQARKLEQVYRSEQESICGLLNLSSVDNSIFEIDELANLSSDLGGAYGALNTRLESYQERIDNLDQSFAKLLEEGPQLNDPKALALRLRNEILLRSQDLVTELDDDVLAMQLIQARARTESVLLPEVDVDPETAVQIARKNRRDWANARAALVDSWRFIEVVADDLESDLDFVITGDIQNIGNDPLDLRSSNGRLRVGLQWDAPLTRLLERNRYRAALIDYERTKRDYYQFEDGVWQLMRAEVRQLHANRLTFELGRQAVRIAARQIELTTDRRADQEARGDSGGPTAARDVIDALAALLDAQNQLLNIFVSYEVVRRGLDFDMGTMELTADGIWLDPGEISTDALLGLPGVTDGGMIGCSDCCLPYRRLPVEPDFTGASVQPRLESYDPDGFLESQTPPPHDAVIVARLPDAWQNWNARNDHSIDAEPVVTDLEEPASPSNKEREVSFADRIRSATQ